MKKYEREHGHVFSKKTKNLVYKYLLEAKNLKAKTVELVIKEQLPVLQNDQIKAVKPDQSLEISFSVTHPNDVWLFGIE